MRKSELFKLYESSYNKIRELNAELDRINAENSDLKAKIKELELDAAKLRTEKENAHLSDSHEVKIGEISEEKEYGAKMIGKIVVSATRRCNTISSDPTLSNGKELINLILGRTEVAKAEIMNVLTLDCDFSVKTEMINREVALAEDYFLSIMGQF